MTISVSCTCGKSFRVKPELAGKRVKCPNCGGPLDIPKPEAPQNPNNDLLDIDLSQVGLGTSSSPAGLPPNVATNYGLAGGSGNATGKRQAKGTHPAIWAAAGAGALLLLLGAGFGIWKVLSPTGVSDGKAQVVNTTSLVSETSSKDANKQSSAVLFKDAKKGWSTTLDAPKTTIQWPVSLGSKIPTPPPTSQLIYSATPSPFVVFGLDITGGFPSLFDLVAKKKTGEITEKVEFASLCALSSDGQFFASRYGRPGAPDGKVNLMSFKTRASVKQFSCDEPQMLIQEVVFSRPDRLVTLTTGASATGRRVSIRVWSIPDAKLLNEVQPQFGFGRKQMAISPGGRYMVANEGDRLYAIDLDAGAIVGNLSIQEISPKSIGIVTGLSFSPDGRQIGLVQSQTNTVFSLVDFANGKLVDAIEIAGKPPLASAYRGEPIEWLDDKGWSLFGSTIIEKKSRRLVWNLQPQPLDRLTERLTLPTGWVVHHGRFNQKSLQFVSIPWDKIDASLAAIDASAESLLRPGQAVSLELQIGNLQHGTVEDTKARLAKLFSDRFAADKIEVKEGQPVSLKVEYSEAKGEMLAERNGISGPLTGRSFQATDVDMKLTLGSADGSKTYWTDTDKYAPRLVTVTQAEVTEAVVRDSIFRQLLFSLSEKQIPYFVPIAADQVALPGTTLVAEE